MIQNIHTYKYINTNMDILFFMWILFVCYHFFFAYTSITERDRWILSISVTLFYGINSMYTDYYEMMDKKTNEIILLLKNHTLN